MQCYQCGASDQRMPPEEGKPQHKYSKIIKDLAKERVILSFSPETMVSLESVWTSIGGVIIVLKDLLQTLIKLVSLVMTCMVTQGVK
uniref:Uncharacterized protein n=1 Tax=Timema monikensis TaxID=170555 RepID=A0A7R9EJX9_9NEOP|nr:unnamed protein product [Timema monikensis]